MDVKAELGTFKKDIDEDDKAAFDKLIATARIVTSEVLLFEACQESLSDDEEIAGGVLEKLNNHFKAMKHAEIAASAICPAIWAFAQKVVKGIALAEEES